MIERDRFEDAWREEYPLHGSTIFTRSGVNPDAYVNTRVQDGWLMWQACSAAHSAGAQEPEWCERCGYPCKCAQPQPMPQTDAARDVLAERQRQVSVEGWTPEHDDAHDPGVLASAAAAYAGWAADMLYPLSMGDGDRDREGAPPIAWPWDREWWKPVNPRRALEKAAALILAEIERLDRAKGE